jgi:hypothetical protein
MTQPSNLDQPTDLTSSIQPARADPESTELQKQVLAHVREFGPRKYQAFYTRAKQCLESGLQPDIVRKNLIGEVGALPPVPESGAHFISKVHHAKLQAFYHVVRHAVEDALANRPVQFQESFGQAE